MDGELARGGTLCMSKVKGMHQANLTAAFANGATFDVEWVQIMTPDNPADGRWLFANLQGPGITFAITGPWKSGAL